MFLSLALTVQVKGCVAFCASRLNKSLGCGLKIFNDTRLRDVSLFKQAFVALDTVCWPGDLNIAPEPLYDRSVPLES
jgi:hypothetical protein